MSQERKLQIEKLISEYESLRRYLHQYTYYYSQDIEFDIDIYSEALKQDEEKYIDIIFLKSKIDSLNNLKKCFIKLNNIYG
jgi:hypothetical protein